MEQSDIFKSVQDALREPPMLLIGSGYSSSHNLPGMSALAKHLVSELDGKYSACSCWQTFRDNLEKGQDLETALSGLTLSDDLLNDIRIKTWELISREDLALFDRITYTHEELPLSQLLKYLYRSQPQKIDIITTNYDRLIEYACDAANLPVNTGFSGYYSKHYTDCFPSKKSVNLIKVHGSLDVYRDEHNAVVSLPLQRELPKDHLPEIITPGLSKYQAILKGTPRLLLAKVDSVIRAANAFLCIGYGFNDEQIQENIIQKARAGTPIVLVTRSISEKTARLLDNNAQHAISICKDTKSDKTCFCINRECFYLDGTYWTVDGLMSIIS